MPQITHLGNSEHQAGENEAAFQAAGRGACGATPSFFCKLVDDVVYWNTSRFSG